MSEHEVYGMPQKKLIGGHYYEYNELASSKADAIKKAKDIRSLGLKARVVPQHYHGYVKYHLYFRGSGRS